MVPSLSNEAHDKHGWRRDDVALAEPPENRHALHFIPKLVETKKDERRFWGIGEVAQVDNQRGDNRQQKHNAGDDLIGVVDAVAKPVML